MTVKYFLVMVFAVLLAGCTTSGNYKTGSGPVTLSPGVKAMFAEYIAEAAPGHFFVSEDGRAAGYSYCPAATSSACSGSTKVLAYNSCKRRAGSRECYAYAFRNEVVWDTDAPPPQ